MVQNQALSLFTEFLYFLFEVCFLTFKNAKLLITWSKFYNVFFFLICQYN